MLNILFGVSRGEVAGPRPSPPLDHLERRVPHALVLV